MTIFERNGKLYVQYYNGSRQVRKSTGLDDTKENRRLIKKDVFPQIAKMLVTGVSLTLEKTFNYYVETYIKEIQHIKEFKRFKRQALQYQEIFNDRKITTITRHEIKQVVNDLLTTNAPKTVQKKLSILRGIFSQAIEDEAIKDNPCDNIKIPKHEKPTVEPIPIEDIKKLLSVTDGWFHNFIALATLTGMRTGELIGLQWSDIDETHIHVRQSLRLGQLTTPKTAGSIRSIPITDQISRYIQDQYSITGDRQSYVFLNTKGKHLFDASTIRKNYWIHAVKRAGIKYNKPYATRHTYAVEALNSGKMRITDIAKIMGHSDTTMLLTTYARYIKSELIKPTDFIDLSTI